MRGRGGSGAGRRGYAWIGPSQPIAAPEGSEINHGIHRNTRKRESESTSTFRVLPCFPWLLDMLGCYQSTDHGSVRDLLVDGPPDGKP